LNYLSFRLINMRILRYTSYVLAAMLLLVSTSDMLDPPDPELQEVETIMLGDNKRRLGASTSNCPKGTF